MAIISYDVHATGIEEHSRVILVLVRCVGHIPERQ